MSGRKRMGILVAVIAITVALSGSVAGVGPSEGAPLPLSAFMPITLPQPTLSPGPTLAPTPSPTLAPKPKAAPRSGGYQHQLRGVASWGYGFKGNVVTRLKRGTPIKVCGPKGCWSGKSWGYGPAKYTGRIADLDVHVFEDICGPRSQGVCMVDLAWK